MLFFFGGRKPEAPGEKPSKQGRELTPNAPWREASSLTTAPPLLPQRSHGPLNGLIVNDLLGDWCTNIHCGKQLAQGIHAVFEGEEKVGLNLIEVNSNQYTTRNAGLCDVAKYLRHFFIVILHEKIKSPAQHNEHLGCLIGLQMNLNLWLLRQFRGPILPSLPIVD